MNATKNGSIDMATTIVTECLKQENLAMSKTKKNKHRKNHNSETLSITEIMTKHEELRQKNYEKWRKTHDYTEEWIFGNAPLHTIDWQIRDKL